jgi:DNA helicase-2/ATP-dependent DNA helicase PcrA
MKKSEELKFTRQQLEVINHDSGPILVVAGAGTGKTAVITQRVARLILDSKAKPEEILALTFTDKAAAEMQQRVDELLPYGYLDTQIMTFHALADRIMREFALDAGISPEFQLLTDVQQTIILQEVLSNTQFKYFSPQNDPFGFISSIKSAISRLKDEGISAEEFASRVSKLKNTNEGEENESMPDLSEIYLKYSAICDAKNSLDFGDLLLKLQHLLKNRKTIRKELQNRYKYILVDEYQDTNSIQMQIILELLNKDKNIMVVGDDDQAIYRFRGASVQNILSFRSSFADSKLVVLKDNYRSGQAILDAGYDLIQFNNPERLEVSESIDKKLTSHKYPEAKVSISEYGNKLGESEGLVDKISELIESGVETKEIAILLRKNNQIKSYILELQKQKIPYHVHQDVDLFDQKSVKMMVVLSKSIADPSDSSALYQLLISGLFNKNDIHQIIEYSSKSKRINKSLYQYLIEDVDKESWLDEALNSIVSWREMIPDYTAGEVLFRAVKSSGFLKKALDESASSIDMALEVQYMTDFFKLVKQFEIASSNPSLTELCEYLDEIRQSSADVMSDISPLDISGVQIMTVHKAKGLEFDHVFLPELTEQTFPSYNRGERVRIPAEIIDPGSGDQFQEERRLFYVALTRARQHLFLSYAKDHGLKRDKKVSRFVVESLGKDWLTKAQTIPSQRSMSELLASFEPVEKKIEKEKILSRLFKGDWLYLTTNQIADYLRSPKEFWLFHVLHLPKGPFHSLVYGSSMHAALEHYYKYRLKEKPVKVSDVLKVYESSWSSEGFVSVEHEKTLFENGKKVIAEYIERHKNDGFKPISIEQPFELQLTELKTVISGRYDIVLGSDEGTEIRDFKTSRVKDQKKADTKAKQSIQLGIYALSWEKLQQSPVSSTSLEFIEDGLVGKNTKVDNAKTLELIEKAVKGIKNMEFDEKGENYVDFDKFLI